MTVVNPKSISGITSITTGSGSDNLLTIHTSDASSTERVRINSSGDVIVGSGITVSPDGDIFATGVTTATTFVGALTGTASGNSVLSGSTDNTIATVTGANALQGEANLTYDGNNLQHSIDSAGEGIRIKATGDHWTGFYGNANRSSADTWLVNLTGQWNNTTVGQIAILAGADTTNKDDGRIAFYTSVSDGNDPVERMRIDESGRLLVGSTATVDTSGYNSSLQIMGTGADDSSTIIGRFSADGSSPSINFSKSRNGTIGSHTIIQNGDQCGGIYFWGSDGSDYEGVGYIAAQVDGTPGSNDTPGRLVFATTADGAASATERLRITSAGSVQLNADGGSANFSVGAAQDFKWYHDANGPTIFSDANNQGVKIAAKEIKIYEYSGVTQRAEIDTSGNLKINDGNLIVGTAGHGIDFSATSGSGLSELLDDYEEGTWTVTLTPAGGSYSVSHMQAHYVKVGHVCHVQGWWRCDGTTSISGSLTFSGLPFTSFNNTGSGGLRQQLSMTPANIASMTESGSLAIRLTDNATNGTLVSTSSPNASISTWTSGNIQSTSAIYIYGSYITA